MKTTKKQLISEYQDGNYAAVEIYRSTDKRNELHSDYMKHECETLDELPDDYDIACEVYELDQDEYNNTILANACQTADFKAWYGDPDAIVLVILIDYDELHFDGTGYCDDVEDVELTKHGNGNDYLRWTWRGREYWAQGEFQVDKNGILHHAWMTPTGHEIEIKAQYREEPNIDYYVINIEHIPWLCYPLPLTRSLLGTTCRFLRQQRGISIRDLADRAGVSKATVVNVEAGRFAPNIDVAGKLLSALGATLRII